MTTEQSAFWARHNNPHPEPGLPCQHPTLARRSNIDGIDSCAHCNADLPPLPSEQAVTERLADAVAGGKLGDLPPLVRMGYHGDPGYFCDGCSTLFATPDGYREHGCPTQQHRRTTVENVPPFDNAEWMDNMRGRPETITEEAQRLVLGDRQDDYGHPAEDFARTGASGQPFSVWTR